MIIEVSYLLRLGTMFEINQKIKKRKKYTMFDAFSKSLAHG